MLFHSKKASLLPSVWPGTEYTWALIWKKSSLICFESYHGIPYSHTGRVDKLENVSFVKFSNYFGIFHLICNLNTILLECVSKNWVKIQASHLKIFHCWIPVLVSMEPRLQIVHVSQIGDSNTSEPTMVDASRTLLGYPHWFYLQIEIKAWDKIKYSIFSETVATF